MLARQPFTKARRQQQLLLTITRDEVLRHREIVLNPPDATAVCATPSAQSSTLPAAIRPLARCALAVWGLLAIVIIGTIAESLPRRRRRGGERSARTMNDR
jgi:hypothetical protein